MNANTATEDDLFRILSRPSFQEMKKIEHVWIDDGTDHRLFIEILTHHGWTIEEYEQIEEDFYGTNLLK